MSALLTIRGLATHFPTQLGLVKAVDGVDLDVMPGECLGVVGESGSGKSVTFLSVLGLVRAPGRVVAGSIRFDGQELAGPDPRAARALRGRAIAVTLQDAGTALNPSMTVGNQILESLGAHDPGPSAADRRRRALDMLRLVGIPEPETRFEDFPHQFSGGMRQRVMLAIALACRPRLLIADEPTSALDVTIQAQVLDLLAELRARLGMTVVLITHDLGVVAEHCDRVAVMYAGQVVECGPTRQVIDLPSHPYTRGLLDSTPDLSRLDRKLRPIEGQVPELIALGAHCRFRDRCGLAEPRCDSAVAMRAVDEGHSARCVRAGEDQRSVRAGETP
ncbi:MAG: ABC transporter ATP-binding protein [Alphaproteobacteria bacterium]|nr:ABC transporter ATP-binding protein [Alphaproteobacteria bacterium]